MDKDIAIKVEHLSQTFHIPHEKVSSARGLVRIVSRITNIFWFFGYFFRFQKVGISAPGFLTALGYFGILEVPKTTRSDPSRGTAGF